MADGVVDQTGAEALKPVDLAALGSVLRVCDVELVLLEGKGPRAAIDTRVHDEALFCSARLGFQARARFMLPPDWAMVGFVHDADPSLSWCHGVPLAAGTVLTILPEGISEFAFAAGTRMTVVLVPVVRLQRVLSQLSLRSTPPSGQALSLFNAAPGSPLAQHHVELQRLLVAGDVQGLASHAVDALLQEHVQALLAAGPGDHPVNTRARRTHYLIAQRAENFMRLNLRRNIYMNEICDAAGVSERGLRYAFEDLFGTSPNRYLSMLRLCAACRSLSQADGGRRSVKAIALSCGLWDLSRFADNYRKVFGELPRDTLMRAPGGVSQPA